MGENKDLFGEEIQYQPPTCSKKGRGACAPRGHIKPPGSGPAGETCGSCAHLVRKKMAKVYLKCGLNRARWTGGRKTDVAARSPACSLWEKDDEK